jgi:hypothetical protein
LNISCVAFGYNNVEDPYEEKDKRKHKKIYPTSHLKKITKYKYKKKIQKNTICDCIFFLNTIFILNIKDIA